VQRFGIRVRQAEALGKVLYALALALLAYDPGEQQRKD
jgi:hypothetical protein